MNFGFGRSLEWSTPRYKINPWLPYFIPNHRLRIVYWDLSLWTNAMSGERRELITAHSCNEYLFRAKTRPAIRARVWHLGSISLCCSPCCLQLCCCHWWHLPLCCSTGTKTHPQSLMWLLKNSSPNTGRLPIKIDISLVVSVLCGGHRRPSNFI